MNPCRLTFEITGQTSNPVVPVSGVTVFGTVAHPYTQVEVSVRTLTAGPAIFQGTATVEYPPPSTSNSADPANDGAWHITFRPGFLSLPCGLNLFIDVQAIAPSASSCPDSGWRSMRCKLMPGVGWRDNDSGSPGGPGSDDVNVDENAVDWSWPDPPHIACPRWGRNFTVTLAVGAAMLMTGLALAQPALAAAGFAVILVAAGLYIFWRSWCVPSMCVLLGALIWVMKRTTILGAVLSAITLSAVGLCTTLAAGGITGALVAAARRRRCSLPKATAPLNQLPMW